MTQGVLKTHGICLMMYFKNNWNAGPFFLLHGYHCRVPDKEWSFQDGGLYIIKKVGVKILTIIVLYRLS